MLRTTERVSLSDAGVQGNSSTFFTSLSGDGGKIAFYSYASTLVSSDTNGQPDIFVATVDHGPTIAADATVNTTTLSFQNEPSIAALPGGRYVVTWTSTESGTANDIRARIFNADGTPFSANGSTADFVVNTTTSLEQILPSVHGLSDGRFVVAWASRESATSADYDIRGRIFNADGTPYSVNGSAAEFAITTTTPSMQLTPSVAALDNAASW